MFTQLGLFFYPQPFVVKLNTSGSAEIHSIGPDGELSLTIASAVRGFHIGCLYHCQHYQS